LLDKRLSSLEVYGIAIRKEIEAARAYQQIVALVGPKEVKRKVRFLRDEERKHRSMLEEMYRREFPDVALVLPKSGQRPPLQVALDEKAPLTRVFELAMAAEKAAEKFYAEAAERSDSQSGRKLLNYLGGMERGHYFLLKSEYDLLNEFDRYESYKRFSQEHLGA
jgi:rubrerythrin